MNRLLWRDSDISVGVHAYGRFQIQAQGRQTCWIRAWTSRDVDPHWNNYGVRGKLAWQRFQKFACI